MNRGLAPDTRWFRSGKGDADKHKRNPGSDTPEGVRRLAQFKGAYAGFSLHACSLLPVPGLIQNKHRGPVRPARRPYHGAYHTVKNCVF